MRILPFFPLVMGLLTATATNAEDDKPPTQVKAIATAWGKPVGGLQAGICVRPGKARPDTALELAIVVRNVGEKDATLYEPLGLYFLGENDEGTVSARPAFEYGGFAQPGAYLVPTIGPGKEHTLLGGLRAVRSGNPQPFGQRAGLAQGNYRVGVDRFELRVGERKTIELGTGYLDVEVRPEKKGEK